MSYTYAVCSSCEKVNRVPLETADGRQPVCGDCKSELPLDHGVSEVTAGQLAILASKSPLPVVVDFWAPWCAPCKVFGPTFVSAAQRLAGRAVFAKVNTEANPLAANSFQIRGIPTLLVLRNGMEIARQSGALPQQAFLGWLGTLLKEAA